MSLPVEPAVRTGHQEGLAELRAEIRGIHRALRTQTYLVIGP